MTAKNFNFDDSLASVMQRAAINEVRIPLLHAPLFKFVSDIQDGMMAATAPPVYGDQVPILLVLQAQHYFLGATRIALGGMLSPVFPLLRASLESVAYAILAQGSKERCIEWIKRDESKETRSTFRGTFTFSKAVSKLKGLDVDLAANYDYLYEASITHGAHPNIAGVMGSVTSTAPQAGEANINMMIINNPGTDAVVDAFDSVVHFGAAVGAGIRYALPKHQAAAATYDRFLAISNEMGKAFDARMASAKERE